MNSNIGIKFLQGVGLIVAGIIILAAVLLYSIRFTTPLLQKHHHELEVWVGRVLAQPVTIGKIKVDRTGISPEVQFQDVSILNRSKNKVIVHVDNLYVRIDVLQSLVNQSLEPGMLIVSGAHLELYQNKDINLDKFTSSSQQARHLITWLLSQGKIDLEHISINWHKADNKLVAFSDIRLQIVNSLLSHKIVALGRVTKPGLTWFRGVVHLRGLPGDGALTADGYVSAKNLDFSAWAKNFAFDGARVVSGYADLRSWFYWHDGVLQRLQTLLNLRDSVIQLGNGKKIVVKRLTANTLLKGDAEQGSIAGNYSHMIINYAKMFRQPLAINDLQGVVAWQKSAHGWKINLDHANLKTNDLGLVAQMQLTLPSDSSGPVINLLANYRLNKITQAKKYFPVTIMTPNLVSWLDKAFVAGNALEGKLVLRGNLRDFPFADGNGQFSVASKLNSVDLNHAPGWPLLKNINGSMLFSGKSMTIKAQSSIAAIPLHNIVARIPDLTRPVLHVTGVAASDNTTAMRFINNSPLQSSVGKSLNGLQVTGPMRLLIGLQIPLGKTPGNTHASGKITQLGGTLSVPSWGIKFTQVKGPLYFHDKSLSSIGMQANLFQQPTKIVIATRNQGQKNSVIQLHFNGSLLTDSLQNILHVDLSKFIEGKFSYHAVLSLPVDDTARLVNNFLLNSNLTGVVVHLPAPFTKLRQQKRKLHLVATFGGLRPIRTAISYGNDVHAALMFLKNKQKYSFLNGSLFLGVGVPRFHSGKGLIVRGVLPELQWSDWQPYISTDSFSKQAVIRSLNLRIAVLHAFQQRLLHAQIKLYPQHNNWLLHLRSSVADGVITIPSGDGNQPIRAKFSKLYLVDGGVAKNRLTPNKIPALDISSDNFRYGKNGFDHVVIAVSPVRHGLAINKLNIISHLFNLSATGRWLSGDDGQITSLYGTLTSHNVGALLSSMHKTDNLVGGKGSVTFSLHWPAAPFAPKMSILSGNLMMKFTDGSIVHLSKQTQEEIGIGRVLNLFSLQSLPRRLTLNFSDLTSKGFVFDVLKGNFKLINGNAYTSDAFLDGGVAHISLAGRIGLYQQDYDVLLKMIPNVTSSLPILMTLAGGPIAGAVTWAADELFRHTLQPATAYKYKVTGSWQHPQVVKLTKQNQLNNDAR